MNDKDDISDTYLMSLTGMSTLSDKTASCLFFLMC